MIPAIMAATATLEHDLSDETLRVGSHEDAGYFALVSAIVEQASLDVAQVSGRFCHHRKQCRRHRSGAGIFLRELRPAAHGTGQRPGSTLPPTAPVGRSRRS
jgi:hypothetical protein